MGPVFDLYTCKTLEPCFWVWNLGMLMNIYCIGSLSVFEMINIEIALCLSCNCIKNFSVCQCAHCWSVFWFPMHRPFYRCMTVPVSLMISVASSKTHFFRPDRRLTWENPVEWPQNFFLCFNGPCFWLVHLQTPGALLLGMKFRNVDEYLLHWVPECAWND